MKKIKRLELRTGQVLNPLQQGFVVGGHDHVWEKVNGCICNKKWILGSGVQGDTHKAYCIEPITIEQPSGIAGWGIEFLGGSSSRPCSAVMDMAFLGWNSQGEKVHMALIPGEPQPI